MKTTQRHLFTLVELLVSMAVLVVMVGFMFEFVSGAQKIWTSSSGGTSLFEQSELVFNYIGTDLKNAQAESVLGEKVPFFYEGEYVIDDNPVSTGGNGNGNQSAASSNLIFVTRDADGKAVPVHYYFQRAFDGEKVNKLYRLTLDDPYEYQRYPDALNSFEVIETLPEDVPLAENVYGFDVQALAKGDPTTGASQQVNGYANVYPYAVRVTIRLYDPKQIPNYENLSPSDLDGVIDEYLHTFTKIFLIK